MLGTVSRNRKDTGWIIWWADAEYTDIPDSDQRKVIALARAVRDKEKFGGRDRDLFPGQSPPSTETIPGLEAAQRTLYAFRGARLDTSHLRPHWG